ncbi:MAG: NAD-dependent epimerase/dehydratase family protein [Thaumarchaeota archaeon]|nr:NAD-dependent epimerase/dehydratase family protein [Nitrososphaerota archaeon]
MKTISKVLVTGGAGFIGSHIVDELVRRGVETYVIDNLSTGRLENLQHHRENDLLHVIIGDMRNVGDLLQDVSDIDVVFHEAAIASVFRSVKEPGVVHDVNVNATLDLMNYCVKKGIGRFVFASTGAVYGTLKDKPASEDLACRPISPYGASKLSIENYLGAYQSSYGLETVALRYLNVYGPRQTMNDYSGVITIFTNALLRREQPTVHGDGQQTRDFVHVKDIVQANMLAMESENAPGEVFNVATGHSITILAMLEQLKSLTGAVEIGHKFGPRREGDIRSGLASVEKIMNRLGFAPKVSTKEGLADVVEFFRTRNELLQGIA